ncbi:cysteine-tRNA ligase [Cyphellophora europaea CBS 101466]|uniref:cysteine--tRNA ligase n=1 Tax=Cyphellophora europaea (strain CBS 101466) TaxID=1220924 RepID=W2RY27_CYPE1|nr:cysteine-tRNA ligase [Cyphellophora europaea CBS 101466]ETN40579.1 cysteine-tRNA ligase [Cyphellophora europaea CBS 101466]
MAQPKWVQPAGQTHEPGLKVYNSLTRSEVEFVPLEKGHVTWYSCGPTVYDDAHLGHARNYVTIDIIRRILSDYFGFKVHFVMNITDVDDKIILRGRQRHLYDAYKESHYFIDDAVRKDAHDAWLFYIKKNLKRISTTPPPPPAHFDSVIQQTYGDILDGGSLEPGQKPGDAEAKVKMHINTSRSAAKALSEDPKMLTPLDFYRLMNDPMCLVLDEKGKASIRGDDHAVFTKLTKEYEERFFRDMDDLNVLRPDELVRVTEYGDEIANYVKQIVDNKFAYKADDGSVYFDIKNFETAGYSYARLKPESRGDKELQDDGEGALSKSSGGKKADADFALWKASKAGEPSWSSEWGPGRPGWHIECSAMASAKLGRQMDIHSGGIDLAFPHHDNELAQSEAYFHAGVENQWVNYFLHMGHLSIQGSKMSKSLKNFTTIHEALREKKEWTSRSLRIVFLLGEWRKGIEITDDMVLEGRGWEDRVDNFFLNALDSLEKTSSTSSEPSVMASPLKTAETKTRDALLRSFATKDVMYAISELITIYNSADKSTFTRGDHHAPAAFITRMVNTFGLNGSATASSSALGWEGLSLPEEVQLFVRPLSSVRDQLRQAAIAKTITPARVKEIVSSIAIPESTFSNRPQRPSPARALSDFRGSALAASDKAATGDADLNKDILALCDRIRDFDLWHLNIYLEDQDSGVARVRPVTEGLRAARREKEDKVRVKEEAKKKRDQEAMDKLMKGKVPPQEMFRSPNSEDFTEWDGDGVPTKGKDGEALPPSRVKKLRKEWAAQGKAHEKWLQALNEGIVKL